jgi:TRAP-type C4-dicarboxylate transport system substrate-binding protein
VKKSSALLAISVITLLLVSLLSACAAPEPAPAPSPAPAPAPAPTPAPAPAEKVTLRLVIPMPPGDQVTMAHERMSQRILDRTGGKYEIKVFPGEQLAKIPEYLDAVRTGAVEMASVGAGIFSGMDQILSEVPMLYNNVRANAAATRPVTELYNNYVFLPKLNQYGIACYTTGALELHSQVPVKVKADWKGLLVGASNPEVAALAESLGASPVVVMWTDTYAALEKGTVDAAFNSTQWIIVGGLTDVSSYVTLFYPTPTFLVININLDVWNKIPKDMQSIITEEAWKACDEINQIHFEAETKDKEILTGLGMEVYNLPKAERDIWKEAVRPYVEKKLSDLGEAGAKIKQIADEANAAYP